LNELIYKLVFSFSTIDQEEKRVELTDSKTIGSSDKTDISIERAGLSVSHGRFNIQNDVLTYTHLSSSGVTLIGDQQCIEKKMYILDMSDVLKLGELTCFILKEIPDPPAFSLEEDDQDEESITLEAPPTPMPKPEDLAHKAVDADPDGRTLIGLEIIQADEFTANQDLIAAEQKRHEEKGKKKDKLLSGLKNSKASKNDNIDFIKSNKYKKRSYNHGSGIIARIIGDIYNVIFFILAYFYTPLFKVGAFNQVSMVASKFITSQKDLVPFIPTEIFNTLANNTLLNFVFCLFIWNLVCSFILGLNFGQWIIGLYADGSFIKVRLTGPLRVMISLLTTPLLIFDAPILLNKRSLKETLTGSQTTTRHSTLTIIFSLLIAPLLFLFLASHNLFTNPMNMALLLKPMSVKKDVINLPSNKELAGETKTIIQSDAIGLELQTKFGNKFELVTEITSDDNYSNLKFHFYDYQRSEALSFTHKQILLSTEVEQIIMKDPLLMYTTPSLYENLVQSDKTALDTSVIKKLYDILTVDKASILPYIFNEGPFLMPILDLRQLLTKKIGLSELNNLTLIKNDLKYYLTFSLRNKKSEQYLLLANDVGISLYTFEKPSTEIDSTEVIRAISAIFGDSKVLTIKPELISTVEIFYNISKTKTLSSEESQYLVQDFMTLARKAMKLNDRVFTDLTLKTFKGNEKGLLFFNKGKNDKNISELRLALNRIQKALYKREVEFFKLNP
jgi:hypothetical protein